MPGTATVFLDADLQIRRWWFFASPDKRSASQDASQQATAGQENSWQAIAGTRPQRLIIVLPASLVYHSLVNVPSQDNRVLQQSVPWAVEDELASPVEVNHVAWRLLDDGQAVAVIDRDVLQQLLEKLAAQGLTPDVVTSELYYLPPVTTGQTHLPDKAANHSEYLAESGSWRKTSGGAVLRRGRWHGGFVPEAALAGQDEFLRRLDFIGECPNVPLPADHINLLQGEFASDERKAGNQRQWRWLLALAAMVLLSGLLVNGIKYARLQTQQTQLKNLQLQTFREAFVDASPSELADPVNAMRSRVKGLESAQGQGSGALMNILSALSAIRQQVPAVHIQSVHWRDNRLEVQVLAPSVEQINRFQQLLRDRSLQWRVTTGTREAVADGVKSIIVIQVQP